MEHAWVILRDEPKWQFDFVQHNSKRGKVTSTCGYSSSSNIETPIELDEYEIPTPTSRLIGQKAAKRKAKGKETSNTNVVDFSGIENAIKEKNAYASRLIELKEAQERRLAYETIMKDTSNMNETQHEAHEKYYVISNHDEYFRMRLDVTHALITKTFNDYYGSERHVGFLECSVQLTVCIGNGRIVQLRPTRFWDAAIMKNIIYACIILHNMIVEDERDTYQNYIDYDGVDDDMSRSEISIGAHPNFRTTYLHRRADVHDKRIHRQLQADLIEHIGMFRK
uniref:No apical meristem-associated C-terminal domain-containing protein n=1 Tax=Cajanus cajan TaxID=3821 RepID=A0A151RW43_CAJCA|nr:hypothetical protein KK1_031610 [Cajanus cajan]